MISDSLSSDWPPVAPQREAPVFVPHPSAVYAWYVVVVLVVINILSSVDRQFLALLVGPVRHDLGISDTQISLLQGVAFAIFYALFGIPLGWLADRRNRRNIIILGVVFWSLMTAACGLASSFWWLFLARIGVGLGEAALLPAAYSLIADYFPLHQRGRALSTFTIAQFAGVGVSWGVGGALILLMQSSNQPRHNHICHQQRCVAVCEASRAMGFVARRPGAGSRRNQ